ncbi:carbamoyltransferase HypF [Desulforhabdus sp. TSK]|uniref:carbamoyltransferase HypF n=1 Tax=Desulforhabdus sp. TSK TaxID=2925014 RepID=UPI001FC7DF6E|nr:carbamoyltransferase HypF [Desulforhabdus sp. TSK]GKT07986.1 carbamoyltransferase HypF [Desulforhabdus sp. TSK]
MEKRRVRVRVRGIVQGVGFRPFVYQLAQRWGLGGWVRNDSNGVELEVAGSSHGVQAFLRDLPSQAPPLARIVDLQVGEREFSPEESFAILASESMAARSTLMAPDVCTCSDCLRELNDPQNRRFRYPFINCTHCGPRYTIIKDIPYDRDTTTMASFAMCPACRAEYDDPMDRRFHAQPNACRECGPRVWLEDPVGRRVAEGDDALRQAVSRLSSGAIVAVKGLGGFHLAVRADDAEAVNRLRTRKIREEKPFAVMFSNLNAVREVCQVTREETSLLESPQRPIVLLKVHEGGGRPGIAPGVAPRNRFLGAFLPYTPLHFLLFDGGSYDALVMTSGNQSDEPMVAGNEEARERLVGIADCFLLHDRDIYMRCDDSVARVLGGKPRPLRRARGYVPAPVFLREPGPSVLGVGAELKSAVCLTRGREAFLSQHIGDLENLETLHSFEKTVAHLQRILEIEPRCIAHDLHPDYLSTQWAVARPDLPLLPVQHHHAHIGSVMAENHLAGPVLGLALDGTGLGTDGTIWGGEILWVDGHRFQRLGHFRQVPLPGGGQAIREPWRMALAYLWSLDSGGCLERFEGIVQRWSAGKVKVLLQMLQKRFNTPLTSSCGRLFDAVSALVGLRDRVTYEGQAAIELEQVLEPDGGSYSGVVNREGGIFILDPFPLVAQVAGDVLRRELPGVVSARFHNGLVALLAEGVRRASEASGTTRVALSGGVFQNAYLFEHLHEALVKLGLEVFSHREVPTNDACIALGQAHVAREWLMAGGEQNVQRGHMDRRHPALM